MPRVFVGNFDFEHELAGNSDLSRAARAVAVHLADVWRTITEPGDLILHHGPERQRLYVRADTIGVTKLEAPPETYTLEPWGWSRSMAQLAAEHGFQAHHPPLDVVRRVNERSFRFRVEQDLNVRLPGACALESVSEAERATASLDGRWVLKAAFGMAGRLQLRGSGPLDIRGRAWVEDKLALGPVLLEPWLDSVGEAGLQFEVPESGPPKFLGVTPQIVDARGSYRGSLFGATEDQAGWETAVDIGLEVAKRVQAEGYFGPLSLDGMRYRDGDGERLRPLQDLNARWSMGRLALGLLRRMPPGECGAWLHLRCDIPQGVWKALQDSGSRFESVTGEFSRQTILLIAPNSRTRAAAIQVLLGV